MIGLTPREIELAGTDGGMHARLAQGLREAARYIETHPDLPIPASVEIHYCIPADSDKAGDDEAFRIAAIIGAKVTGDDDGTSSEARRDFGPAVSYRAVYLTRDRMARHYAAEAALAAAKAQPELAVA
jgi:hypothetical protein